jgi:hypothetical protein
MPLTREEIKLQHRIRNSQANSWVSPNFGDGGWHNTPGTQRFTTEWVPMADRLLVRLYDEPASEVILSPQIVRDNTTRKGVVLKCGPGKWIAGEWWYVNRWEVTGGGLPAVTVGTWEWFPGHRQPLIVKPGDHVVIGKYTDWESTEAGWGENVVICQEADIRGLL